MILHLEDFFVKPEIYEAKIGSIPPPLSMWYYESILIKYLPENDRF